MPANAALRDYLKTRRSVGIGFLKDPGPTPEELQEILTIKSDDVAGRVKTYESIVKGESVLEPGVPESFKILVKELQSLALQVEVEDEEGHVMELKEVEDEFEDGR